MGHPVVHFEMYGPDDELIAKYYSELFGWHMQTMPDGGYTTIDTHGGDGINGGIGKSDRPYSSIVVETDDIQGVLDRAGPLGASTTAPVTEIPGVVTYAQFADPEGNRIGLVKSESGEAPGVSPGDNPPVTWFEIYETEPKKLWGFYRELFGWTVEEQEANALVYGEIDTGAEGGINGGITQNPMKEAGIAIWAEVDDVQPYVDRAVELGGTELMPPTVVNEDITFAPFVDPQGTVTIVYVYKS
jgi:predicted enzyme related to lactoylglutathione lyase